jgi:hypothetical protein
MDERDRRSSSGSFHAASHGRCRLRRMPVTPVVAQERPASSISPASPASAAWCAASRASPTSRPVAERTVRSTAYWQPFASHRSRKSSMTGPPPRLCRRYSASPRRRRSRTHASASSRRGFPGSSRSVSICIKTNQPLPSRSVTCRDEPVPAPALGEPGRLVRVGRRGLRPCAGDSRSSSRSATPHVTGATMERGRSRTTQRRS